MRAWGRVASYIDRLVLCPQSFKHTEPTFQHAPCRGVPCSWLRGSRCAPSVRRRATMGRSPDWLFLNFWAGMFWLIDWYGQFIDFIVRGGYLMHMHTPKNPTPKKARTTPGAARRCPSPCGRSCRPRPPPRAAAQPPNGPSALFGFGLLFLWWSGGLRWWINVV